MEAVAAAARTSKPVLYRRWPDSRTLLRDVLLRAVVSATAAGDTGSYRTDMLAELQAWKHIFIGPHASAMRAVVATMTHDPDLADAGAGVIASRKKEMTEVLVRGIHRGDVRADVPIDIAWQLAQGVFHHLLITGEPITDELVQRLVDDLLVPFVAPQPYAHTTC